MFAHLHPTRRRGISDPRLLAGASVACFWLVVLLVVVLCPAVAGAVTAADVSGRVEQIRTLGAQTRALDKKIVAELDSALAVDPTVQKADDAVRSLDQAGTDLATLLDDMQSISGLWSEISALDISASAQAYATQQHDIAEKNLEYYGLLAQQIADYRVLYDREKLAALSRPEIRRMIREIKELARKMSDVDSSLDDLEASSHRYFQDHRVAWARKSGTVWWRPVASLVIASVFALLCGILARRKNRNIFGWAIFGFFIPLPALIAILAVSRIDLAPRGAALIQAPPPGPSPMATPGPPPPPPIG
jgi:hypothetical protein